MTTETFHPLDHGSNLAMMWNEDPRMMCVRMSRYKFAAKMLKGFPSAVEIGAGDGYMSKIVAQEVKNIVLVDKIPQGKGVLKCDVVSSAIPFGPFAGAYSLDVLEHIDAKDEDAFIRNIADSLTNMGTLIIGMPSLESFEYASKFSKEGHINLKTEDGLRELMKKHFQVVYMFGMNDEVVHTGYGPMCHYRIAVASAKKTWV